MFMLENVANLVHGHKPVFDAVLAALEDVRDASGQPVYNTWWRILDNKTIGGIPQSRQRVYIVGIMWSAQVRPFEFPGPVRMRPLMGKPRLRATFPKP